MPAQRFLVSGKVQGVFFRASTREQALQLGLSGSARNLGDARVEVIASGDGKAVDALARWLRQGPPSAHVTEVVRDSCDEGVDEGFVIA